MKAQVLLFCFSDPARLSAVRKALLPLHIPCRVVLEEDWTAPLGALAGLETEAPAAEDAAALTGEMLVMCGLTEGGIQAVVLALRKAGVYVPYKAVLTPYNKDWSAAALFAELYREHQAILAQRQSAHAQNAAKTEGSSPEGEA